MSIFKGLKSTGKVGCGTLIAGVLSAVGAFTVGRLRDPPTPPSTYKSVSLCEAVQHTGEAVEVSGRPVFVFPFPPNASYSPLEVGLAENPLGLSGKNCFVKGQVSGVSPSFALDFRPSRELSREMERQVGQLICKGMLDTTLDSITLRGTMGQDGVLATYKLVIGGQEYSLLRE